MRAAAAAALCLTAFASGCAELVAAGGESVVMLGLASGGPSWRPLPGEGAQVRSLVTSDAPTDPGSLRVIVSRCRGGDLLDVASANATLGPDAPRVLRLPPLAPGEYCIRARFERGTTALESDSVRVSLSKGASDLSLRVH